MQSNRTTPDFDKLVPVFLEYYPRAKDEVGSNFPHSFGPVLETAVIVDSEHTRDQKTRRSLTGLVVFVGSTSII